MSQSIPELSFKKISTPLGAIYLEASTRGLCQVQLNSPKKVQAKIFSSRAKKILDKAEKQLLEYFAGTRKSFSIPLDLEGSPFQRSVWKQLTEIPFGKTLSYKDIAFRINNPKATRAVGSANGKNPICIIIPCHRVIAADGSIGGYSGGLKVKRRLLKLENQKDFKK